MDNLIRYFDQVKAEEELKERTKSYIKETIAEHGGENIGILYRSKTRRTVFRKFSMAAVPAAACISLIIGGYALYKTPVSYVSCDINPSIEIGINFLNKVVETESFNADGKELLEGCRVMNLSAEEAIKALTLRANEEGYLKEDGSTVIAVTAAAKKAEKAERLKNNMENSVQALLDENDLDAVVYADCSDLQIRTEARQYGLSPGKYKLMLMLRALEPGISTEQYKESRITDILLKADKLLKQNQISVSEESEWDFTLIRNTAEKIRKMYRENEWNRNDYEIQSVSPSAIEPEQEQNQNQTRYQSPNSDSTDPNRMQYQNQSEGSSASAIQQEQTTVQNQTQNAGEMQPGAEQEQTQNQGQEQGAGSDAGSDSTDNGQSSQNKSDAGQGVSPAGNNN